MPFKRSGTTPYGTVETENPVEISQDPVDIYRRRAPGFDTHLRRASAWRRSRKKDSALSGVGTCASVAIFIIAIKGGKLLARASSNVVGGIASVRPTPPPVPSSRFPHDLQIARADRRRAVAHLILESFHPRIIASPAPTTIAATVTYTYSSTTTIVIAPASRATPPTPTSELRALAQPLNRAASRSTALPLNRPSHTIHPPSAASDDQLLHVSFPRNTLLVAELRFHTLALALALTLTLTLVPRPIHNMAKMSAALVGAAYQILKRESEDDSPDGPDSSQMEIFSSWALFIMIMLLIAALFTSYMLQQKKVEAVHETVISIFAGMTVGLILRLSSGTSIQSLVSFNYQIFFNLLLPPIILGSGYELHQANFFRNIGTILTFAFAGTFISAIVLGLILYVYTRVPIDGFEMTFVDAISVGATLSATDPVTILAIFNTYKVDPKLYTIIFGESMLNDAVAIVLFETAQRYKEGGAAGTLGLISLMEGIGIFLAVFFGSLIIGVLVGIGTALVLKYTYVRRFPKIESCLVVLIAYASYFFSNGLHMSGIVTLLFCGITLKHYAYYNMSRRTQLTTKYIFQVLAQLSENFIFIYLGLSLFTDSKLEFKPLFIIITVMGICVARWFAVFPLSRLINWFIRYRAKRRGKDVADELPYSYQAMLFWAGLRGAVGVALAAGLTGANAWALKATVLVVVVLTVIIFGGTTARMLEILGIRTGVVEEIDSDDEFDIEAVPGGTYYKPNSTGFGNTPRGHGSVPLDGINGRRDFDRGTYVTGNSSPDNGPRIFSRKNSTGMTRESEIHAAVGDESDLDLGSDTSDLPPAAKRTERKRGSPPLRQERDEPYPTSGSVPQTPQITASGAISSLLHGTAEDHAAWFKQLDEGFIKPKLLLDGGKGPHAGPS